MARALPYTGRPQRRWLIKRVVAVPGDPRPAAWLPATADPGERLVPGGKFVVLGDNRPVSYDSRQIGYFPADRLLGIAVRRMTPSIRDVDGMRAA